MHPIRILQRGRNDTAQFEVQLVDIKQKRFFDKLDLVVFLRKSERFTKCSDYCCFVKVPKHVKLHNSYSRHL